MSNFTITVLCEENQELLDQEIDYYLSKGWKLHESQFHDQYRRPHQAMFLGRRSKYHKGAE